VPPSTFLTHNAAKITYKKLVMNAMFKSWQVQCSALPVSNKASSIIQTSSDILVTAILFISSAAYRTIEKKQLANINSAV